MKTSSLILALVASVALIAYRTDPVLAEEGSACDYPSAHVCGAGDLPRVTSRDWQEADVQRFVERAAKGTVAVAADGKTVTLLPDCRLPGTYTEVLTQPGQGRLWATNRVLLLTGEVDRVACADATHTVAAFARARSGSLTFSGVLVPLPCPSVGDSEPARGCVARGLTGPVRKAQAGALREKLKATPVNNVALTKFLEVYALAPDDDLALGFTDLGHVNTECALYDHARWVGAQYRTRRLPSGQEVTTLRPANNQSRPLVDMPTLDYLRGSQSCLHHPAFRKCFAGIAEPVDESWACWEPAPVPAPAPPPARAVTPTAPPKPKATVSKP